MSKKLIEPEIYFVGQDEVGPRHPTAGFYVAPLTAAGRAEGPFASRDRAEEFARGRSMDLRVA